MSVDSLHFWFHCSRSLTSHVQQVSILVASQLHGLLNMKLDFPVGTCVNECIVMFWILLSSCRTQSNIFQVGLGGIYLNYGLIKGVVHFCPKIPIDPLPQWLWLCCHELWHHILMTSCRARNGSVNGKFVQ